LFVSHFQDERGKREGERGERKGERERREKRRERVGGEQTLR